MHVTGGDESREGKGCDVRLESSFSFREVVNESSRDENIHKCVPAQSKECPKCELAELRDNQDASQFHEHNLRTGSAPESAVVFALTLFEVVRCM